MRTTRASVNMAAGALLLIGSAACDSTDGAVVDLTGDGPSGGITDVWVELRSARGVSLDVVVTRPANVQAAVLLFEGGDGRLSIGGTPAAPIVDSEGFLARNAHTFAENGLLAALIDVPSDRAVDGIDPGFRQSAEHAQDVEAVLDWVEGETSVPIWVLGMSMGSFSATNAAIRLGARVDGYGVASALTTARGALAQSNPNGILDMDVAQVASPAIVVGHQDDMCPDTPASGVSVIVSALTAADPVSSRLFVGGSAPQSAECGPLSPHGYFGMDDEVVAFISDFIKAH